MTILDTNVLSEALKPAPSDLVLSWLGRQDPSSVFITAITLAELLYGIEILPAGKRRTQLAGVLNDLFTQEFRGRILPFDEQPARVFPKIVASREAAGRPISQFDAMIAATCRARQATLATRNVRDFEHCGITVLNPWQ